MEQAIDGHGGAERVELARTFDLSATLENQSVHQSPEPDPPFRNWTVKARYVSDPDRERFFVESDAQFPSFRNFTRTVSTRGEGWLVDYLAKTKVPETSLSGIQSLMVRLLPQNLLLEARRRGATLRWVGESADARGPWTVTKASIVELKINNAPSDAAFLLPPDHRTIESYDPAMQMETVAPRLHVQTDLFNAWSCFKGRVPNEDIGHTTALGDTQALIAAVEHLGLQVDRVIGGHGRDVDYAWMKAYTARRAADGLPMWACTAQEMR